MNSTKMLINCLKCLCGKGEGGEREGEEERGRARKSGKDEDGRQIKSCPCTNMYRWGESLYLRVIGGGGGVIGGSPCTYR